VPSVASEDDTRNVDPAFLKERVSLSDAFDAAEDTFDYSNDIFGCYCFEETFDSS